MEAERTAWAEDTGLDDATIEALTLVAEEASARGLEVFLDPRDPFSEWPPELEGAGAQDLAERCHEFYAVRA